ncbi:arginine decarboxylase, partial [Salmonella enterica subsp. enterica serovar Infantis]
RLISVYVEQFAMLCNPRDHSGQTVFASQSTHKLLISLSQASFIHFREGRISVNFTRFNQANKIHPTTTPQYTNCASN